MLKGLVDFNDLLILETPYDRIWELPGLITDKDIKNRLMSFGKFTLWLKKRICLKREKDGIFFKEGERTSGLRFSNKSNLTDKEVERIYGDVGDGSCGPELQRSSHF